MKQLTSTSIKLIKIGKYPPDQLIIQVESLFTYVVSLPTQRTVVATGEKHVVVSTKMRRYQIKFKFKLELIN